MSAYQTLIVLCIVASTTALVVIASIIYQLFAVILYAKSALFDIRDALRGIHTESRVHAVRRIQFDPTQRS